MTSAGFATSCRRAPTGLVNALQLGSYLSTGARPPHNNDQLSMYDSLTTAAPNIQPAQLGRYFKDATFGVRAGGVEPRPLRKRA